MQNKKEFDRHFRAAFFRGRPLSRADADYIKSAMPQAPWDSRLVQVGQIIAVVLFAEQIGVGVVRHSLARVVSCGVLLAIVVLGSMQWWLLRRNIARAISAPPRSADPGEQTDV